MVNKPLCIDIYQGDNVQDEPVPLGGFDRVKEAGIPFLIHKATEGLTLVDRRYAARRKVWMDGKNNVPLTMDDGTVQMIAPRWGAYCFFHGSDPQAEADHFLSVAELEPGDIAVLDWENVGASGYSPPADAARAWLTRVEGKLGRTAVIYSGNVAKEQIRGHDPFFAAHKLWLCEYGPHASCQASWSYPWLWQDDGDKYGPGPHTIPGIDGYCDNSTIIAPMTVARLLAEWGN